jgi:hypothetical protein
MAAPPDAVRVQPSHKAQYGTQTKVRNWRFAEFKSTHDRPSKPLSSS